MENRTELNLEQMEDAVGGTGGSKKKLPPKPGCDIYLIRPGDTLTKIGNRYGVTPKYLKSINPGIINDVNDITAGRYMYVPATGIA